jgi:hypothetical protein
MKFNIVANVILRNTSDIKELVCFRAESRENFYKKASSIRYKFFKHYINLLHSYSYEIDDKTKAKIRKAYNLHINIHENDIYKVHFFINNYYLKQVFLWCFCFYNGLEKEYDVYAKKTNFLTNKEKVK